MTRFRHDLILRLVKIMDAVLVFVLCKTHCIAILRKR